MERAQTGFRLTRGLTALQRLPFFARKFLRDLLDPLRYASNTYDVQGVGLGRYYLVYDEEELKAGGSQEFHSAAIFERGVATVEALLPLYDAGWWSLHDLYHLEVATPRNPCTAHYHDIHVKQLTVMHAITGRESFRAFVRRWAAYEDRWQGRLRAYAEKAVFIARRRLA